VKVAIIYNKDMSGVINTFGIQNKEKYGTKTVSAVAAALESGGHNVEIIDGNMHVIESLQSFMPKVMEGERMGMVFNMAYGIQGESRYTHLPSMLEMLGIPYVGSTPSGHALALDKVITKIIMQKQGLPTPNFWVFSNPHEDIKGVEYPVIIKPKMEAVSFGLRVVHNETDMREAVKYIIEEFEQQALVEQFIRGREFAIGMVGNNPVEAFPILEINLKNDSDAIQSVDDKKYQPRDKICPASIPKEIYNEMVRLSIAAFKALQLRDFARVDIRMDNNNNIYLLEVNSMASLGKSGSYAYAAKVAGYDYKALVNKMLDVAAVRYFANSSLLLNGDIKTSRIPFHVRIRGFLRGRQSAIENTLKRMVNYNTYVRNVEGVNTLGNLIKKELSPLGFSTESIPQVEVGNIVFLTNSDDGDCDILLLGNLDNGTRISKQEYYRENQQKLYGTGIWEHKGGLAVMIAAIQSLRFIRQLRKTKLGILLTCDDSLQGRFAKSIIMKKAQHAKYILGLHGAFLNGGIVTSRSGSAVYKCHMSLIDNSTAKNVALATGVFSRLIHAWTELSDEDSGLVISPHRLEIDSNITEPFAHGEVTLSVRFNDSEQMKLADEKLKKLVMRKKYRNILQFQLEGGVRRPSMLKTEGVDEIWQIIRNIAEKLDIRLREEHRWSSADISFIGDTKHKIDGLGPIGIKPPDKSEYILRHSLIERAALLAMTIIELNKRQ
jgi:D-alanine-D-alanine ligase